MMLQYLDVNKYLFVFHIYAVRWKNNGLCSSGAILPDVTVVYLSSYAYMLIISIFFSRRFIPVDLGL